MPEPCEPVREEYAPATDPFVFAPVLFTLAAPEDGISGCFAEPVVALPPEVPPDAALPEEGIRGVGVGAGVGVGVGAGVGVGVGAGVGCGVAITEVIEAGAEATVP